MIAAIVGKRAIRFTIVIDSGILSVHCNLIHSTLKHCGENSSNYSARNAFNGHFWFIEISIAFSKCAKLIEWDDQWKPLNKAYFVNAFKWLASIHIFRRLRVCNKRRLEIDWWQWILSLCGIRYCFDNVLHLLSNKGNGRKTARSRGVIWYCSHSCECKYNASALCAVHWKLSCGVGNRRDLLEVFVLENDDWHRSTQNAIRPNVELNARASQVPPQRIDENGIVLKCRQCAAFESQMRPFSRAAVPAKNNLRFHKLNDTRQPPSYSIPAGLKRHTNREKQ